MGAADKTAQPRWEFQQFTYSYPGSNLDYNQGKAIDDKTFEQIFNDPGGQVIVEDEHIRLMVVQFSTAEIIQWIG
jgi:hypothetical protein